LALTRAAATSKARHRLDELANAWIIGRRVDGKPAELPIQPNLAQAGSSDKSVARNVVDFELAGIDVAQHEVGRASRVDWGDARELPIQADRSNKRRAGQLVVTNVVDFQSAGIGVAQEQIGFTGIAAEIADPRELPTQADGADEGGIGDLMAIS
jgi:hypothetical protein